MAESDIPDLNVTCSYGTPKFNYNNADLNTSSIIALKLSVPECCSFIDNDDEFVKVGKLPLGLKNVKKNELRGCIPFKNFLHAYQSTVINTSCILNENTQNGTQIANANQMITFKIEGNLDCGRIVLANISTMNIKFVQEVTSKGQEGMIKTIESGIEQTVREMILSIAKDLDNPTAQNIIQAVHREILETQNITNIVNTSITTLSQYINSTQKITFVVGKNVPVNCNTLYAVNDLVINLTAEQTVYNCFEITIENAGVNPLIDDLIGQNGAGVPPMAPPPPSVEPMSNTMILLLILVTIVSVALIIYNVVLINRAPKISLVQTI